MKVVLCLWVEDGNVEGFGKLLFWLESVTFKMKLRVFDFR